MADCYNDQKKKKSLISYSFKPSADALLCGQIQPFWEGTIFGGLLGPPQDTLQSAGQSRKVWRTTQDMVLQA